MSSFKNKEIKLLDLKLNSYFFLTCILGGMIVCSLGSIFNISAMVTNNGKMPVYANPIFETDSPDHFITDDLTDVRMTIFIDKFRIKNLYFSLGDVVILSGMFIFVYGQLMYWKTRTKIRREIRNGRKRKKIN